MKRLNWVCTLLVLASVLAGCSPMDPAAKSAKAWLDASLRDDVNKLTERTCTAQTEVVQNQPMWLSAFAAIGLTGTDPQAKADLSGLRFKTANKEGDSAEVQVTGEIRFAPATTPTQQISETLHMVREQKQWKVCQDLAPAKRIWGHGGTLLSLTYPSAEAAQASQAQVVEDAKGIGLAASWTSEADNALFLLLPPMDQSTASELVVSKAGASGVIQLCEPAGPPTASALSLDLWTPIAGMMIVLQADLPTGSQATVETMDAAVQVVDNRLAAFGLTGYWVQRVGSDRVLVLLVGGLPTEPDRLIAIISQTGLLELVDTGDSFVETGTIIPDSFETVITGKDVKGALIDFDSAGRPMVRFELSPEGATLLEEHTSRNVGKYMAIAVDKQVFACPMIQTTIAGGSGVITGNFTLQEVTRLAILLKYGPLPVPLSAADVHTIAPAILFGYPTE